MVKLIEVKEFDNLMCNVDYKDDSNYKYLDEKTFAELESMILSYNSTLEADAVEFFSLSSKKYVGKVIRAKNYVGIVQMKSGTQIQILPKIEFCDAAETKRIFMKMLRSMKDFPSKIFQDTNLKVDNMNLYEVFINMYIQEVRQLVKQGIKAAYKAVEQNTNYYKGKLVVSDHIRNNIVRRDRFFVRYEEYLLDRPENRLIKSTLIKLLTISESLENKKEINQLLGHFEMVNRSHNWAKDFARVVNDRNTKDYENLIRWSKVFLFNRSFTTFSGSSSARALLFPMEKVFEAYVGRNLKKLLLETEWEISLQDKGYYLFENQFALRPDVVLSSSDGRKIIMDTKWKSLENNPNRNYGISQSDMYQMYAYAKKYNSNEIWLLYPVNNGLNNKNLIEFRSDDDVVVRLFFIDLLDIQNNLMKLIANIGTDNLTN